MHMQLDRLYGNGSRIYCRILQAGKQSHSPDKPQQQDWLACSLVAVVLSSAAFISGANICYTRESVSGSPQKEYYLDVEVQFDDGQTYRIMSP